MKTDNSEPDKERPLENSDQSAEHANPELLEELKIAKANYEKTHGPAKEKLKEDVQRLSEEKKRITGDANAPAPEP